MAPAKPPSDSEGSTQMFIVQRKRCGGFKEPGAEGGCVLWASARSPQGTPTESVGFLEGPTARARERSEPRGFGGRGAPVDEGRARERAGRVGSEVWRQERGRGGNRSDARRRAKRNRGRGEARAIAPALRWLRPANAAPTPRQPPHRTTATSRERLRTPSVLCMHKAHASPRAIARAVRKCSSSWVLLCGALAGLNGDSH